MRVIDLLRGFVGYFVLVFSVVLLSTAAYFYSFWCTRIQMIKLYTSSFVLIRQMCYKIVGIKIQIRGLHNIPDTPVVFASKHQSAIETSFFFNQFKLKSVYLYKKEITQVPLWGRSAKLFGGVSIDRSKKSAIVRDIVNQSLSYLDSGYNITIFPEGTRIPVHQRKKFKRGIQALYETGRATIVPIALNTGLILPKGSWVIRPGLLLIEFLPPILPGKDSNKFLPELEDQINEATEKLVDMGIKYQKSAL